jgi:hypothetical protein
MDSYATLRFSSTARQSAAMSVERRLVMRSTAVAAGRVVHGASSYPVGIG